MINLIAMIALAVAASAEEFRFQSLKELPSVSAAIIPGRSVSSARLGDRASLPWSRPKAEKLWVWSVSTPLGASSLGRWYLAAFIDEGQPQGRYRVPEAGDETLSFRKLTNPFEGNVALSVEASKTGRFADIKEGAAPYRHSDLYTASFELHHNAVGAAVRYRCRLTEPGNLICLGERFAADGSLHERYLGFERSLK